ncbi:E3 ubiquitin-protein ligase SP1 [Citrus sinensis]|uniref:E3 ubiquitin-protein ligase SP1 n=1 Tax=Citrus sinensis TaxID=2711 RepID=A0ACB8MK39_CITSI|nr:E3 ubiquitin-protein ligase SP1 [Citrus sinensis]
MISWGGISCCLSGAALYLLGRSSGRSQLPNFSSFFFFGIKRFEMRSFLRQSRVSINSRSWFVADGIVDAAISFPKNKTERHFLKHNDAGSWIQDSALMLSMSKEVPWYLDDGTGCVFVVGARGATGFALTVGSEVFEESGRSLVHGTLDYLQGLKMLGVKRIGRLLPTGTSLTVVGEAVKDDIGTVRIQRPHKGPFYVSPKTIDELLENLGKWARVLAAAAVQRSEQDNEGTNGQAENGSDSTQRDRVMPDLCVICLEQEYNAVFFPFGIEQIACCLCSVGVVICAVALYALRA